jgi:hypothetical protein
VNHAELIGGVPLVSVIGTPRTMGENLGSRLKPRLQVLAQYLCEQLASITRPSGRSLTPKKLRKLIHPSALTLARHEPALWMELESASKAAGLEIDDLLIIQGLGDLLSYLQCRVSPRPSTYLCLDPTHTLDGRPLMALSWHLDPALLPYLTLLRRIPAHGPSTLWLTMAGLHPVAGLSEAGMAVAYNEMRVNDGVCGHFTLHQLASMLTAPSIEDALHRGMVGPRHGGGALHLLSANGSRFTLELSGQLATRLSDPLLNVPRVHTNHALDEKIAATVNAMDASSPRRLKRFAGMAVAVNDITPETIAGWFGLHQRPEGDHQPEEVGNEVAEAAQTTDASVLIIMDPVTLEIHLRRSDAPGPLETISL